LIWTFLLVVPYSILTTAEVFLWRRWRSAATAMVALGFAAALFALTSGLFATYKTHAVLSELTSAPQAHQNTFYIVAHYHRFPLQALGVLGIGAAAGGRLWHVRRARQWARGGQALWYRRITGAPLVPTRLSNLTYWAFGLRSVHRAFVWV